MAGATIHSGLAPEVAAARLATEGPNELPVAAAPRLIGQLWSVVRQPMLGLLLGAGVVNFALAEPLDGIVLLSSVAVVIAISLYQQHKTETALAALRDLTSPRAMVVRGGVLARIAGREVVRGDVVVLAEGDRVPADGVVIDAVNVSVNESALTGESVPVRKRVSADPEREPIGPPGGDANPWFYSGTLMVKGRAVMLVKATGVRTELGRIGTALQSVKPERSPLEREVDRFVRVIAWLGLGAATAVVVVFGLTRGRWLEGLLAGIATAMSLLPEEFPVVLTIFLALGAWRMSQHHVLTRRSAAIEALGAASVICADKTGTLTMNSMTVRCLVADGATTELEAELRPGDLHEGVHELVEYGILASPVDPVDPVDRAIAALGRGYLEGTEHLHAGWELVREYPLADDLLALSHVWRSASGADYVVAAKGAPEAIADLCHLDEPALCRLLDQVAHATANGLRVLAVARAMFSNNRNLPTAQHDFHFELVGLVGLHDPIRPGVAEAVADCRRAGVRVVMITGDYPGTALAVARQIGLNTSAGALLGSDLESLTDGELAQAVRQVDVFARMVPEQKLQLIRAFKANGDVVAMTGDGVNDAPALRAADIGIAMGARGTDVARESAALVITDDHIASIVSGIRLGRGIYENLRKAMSYIIAVHVPILGMSLIPVVNPGWPLVLMPVQIAFLELIIDPACSIVFDSEQIDPRIMDRPPRLVDEPMFGRRSLALSAIQGLVALLTVASVYFWALQRDYRDDVVRAVTFSTLVISNLALILVNRSWRLPIWRTFRERKNPAIKWILSATVAVLALVLLVPALRNAFGFGALGPIDWLVAFAAGSASVVWFEIYKIRAGLRRR